MIGLQVIPANGLARYLPTIERMKPRVVVIVDPSPGNAAEIKRVSPHTIIVGRVWRKDGDIHNAIMANPKAAAKWARECIAPVAAGNKEVDFWQFANEVCQISVFEIQQLNAFSIAYVDELGSIGLKAAIGGFSVGNPFTPQESPSHWAAFYPAMRNAKARGGVLLLHAYGAPTIFGPDEDFYLFRYERKVIPFLPQDLKDMPYLYGEYGCDMGCITIGDRRGWRTGYMGNYRQYVADLKKAAEVLAQYPQCLGAAIFTFGTFGDWGDFDVDGDCARLLEETQFPAPATTPYPTVESVRLRLPYVSQIRPVVETDYAPGDCLQASIAALVRAFFRYVQVDELAQMTGLPPGYVSSDIITHGVNLASRLGLRLVWQSNVEPEDLRNELRARRSVILRVYYPFLEKKFDPNYPQYHFMTLTGFEGDDFFYDDPYWDKAAGGGEDIRISATALRRAMWRTSGASKPAQVLLLRSHTLPLVGETTTPPATVDWGKVAFEAETAERRQAVEGRSATAAWIRTHWTEPAIEQRDGGKAVA